MTVVVGKHHDSTRRRQFSECCNFTAPPRKKPNPNIITGTHQHQHQHLVGLSDFLGLACYQNHNAYPSIRNAINDKAHTFKFADDLSNTQLWFAFKLTCSTSLRYQLPPHRKVGGDLYDDPTTVTDTGTGQPARPCLTCLRAECAGLRFSPKRSLTSKFGGGFVLR